MFDIFEQPWTLLLAAVITHIILVIFRGIFPEKRRWWQRLIPVFIVVAAFGLDSLVKTDLEKIKAVIKTGIKAAEEENADAIEAILSDSYNDSYHNTKDDLMRYCRELLSEPLVEKNKKKGLMIEKSQTKAKAILTVRTRFDEESFVYRDFKQGMLIQVRLYLQKEAGNRWLITRAEPLKLDGYSVKWRDIK